MEIAFIFLAPAFRIQRPIMAGTFLGPDLRNFIPLVCLSATIVVWMLFESAGALFGIDLKTEPPKCKALGVGRTCFAAES